MNTIMKVMLIFSYINGIKKIDVNTLLSYIIIENVKGSSGKWQREGKGEDNQLQGINPMFGRKIKI